MGDEYQALARAIRRPMRRWWLKVGSWWIGAAVVLLAVFVWSIWDEYNAKQLGGWSTYNLSRWRFSIIWLDALIMPLLTTGWLLAAIQVRDLAVQLTGSIPAMAPELRSAITFRIAVWHGVLPCALLVMVAYAVGVRDSSAVQWSKSMSADDWMLAASALDIAPYAAIHMLWVLAILSIGRSVTWIALLWHLAFNVIGQLSWLSLAAASNPATPVLYNFEMMSVNIAVSDGTQNVLMVVGLAMYYSVLYFLARRTRRLGATIAVLLGICFILSLFDLGQLHSQLTTAVAAANWFDRGLFPLWSWVHSPDVTAEISLLSFKVEVQIAPHMAALALIIPLAVLAGHYFAISWILRNVKPRRA